MHITKNLSPDAIINGSQYIPNLKWIKCLNLNTLFER